MYWASFVVFLIGFFIVAFVLKFKNKSESYDSVGYFAIGVVLMAFGALCALVIYFVR